jgi:hypothetical protein
MAQIDSGWSLSFALFPTSDRLKGQRATPLAQQPSALSSVIRVALRLLSSSAVPSTRMPRVYHFPLSTLRKGDISTLQKRGHLYFALTDDFHKQTGGLSIYVSLFGD